MQKNKGFVALRPARIVLTGFVSFCRKPETIGAAQDRPPENPSKEKTMTKADLIEKMAKEAGISKVAAGAALKSFVDNVTKSLKKPEGKVTLVGFGTFSVSKRKARKGRNPQTGAPIKIKASKVVKFKAGKGLKSIV
jgi:DNA-binding protein HU-beta